jgi:hypothetical protein
MEYTLVGESVKYRELVKNSRFSDRISFLVSNPQLASVKLDNGVNPCCWGTTTYVIGANQGLKDVCVKNGFSLDDYCSAMGDFVVIPDNDKPGYVGREPMELFLSTLPESDAVKDSVVAFRWHNRNNEEFCAFGLHHSGIYLGNYGGQQIIFHQKEIGQRFQFISLDEFVKELCEESRRTLDVRYYSTKPQHG